MKAPVLIFLLLAIMAGVLAVAGIYVLAGLGWSMIAGSASLMAAAAFIYRGLNANG